MLSIKGHLLDRTETFRDWIEAVETFLVTGPFASLAEVLRFLSFLSCSFSASRRRFSRIPRHHRVMRTTTHWSLTKDSRISSAAVSASRSSSTTKLRVVNCNRHREIHKKNARKNAHDLNSLILHVILDVSKCHTYSKPLF